MEILKRYDTHGIAQLTLNDPDRLNALSDDMLAALQGACDTIAQDPNIRVVIIASTGKAFCAGHDLKEMTALRDTPDNGQSAFHHLFSRCARFMQTLQSMPQPVIAQVNGVATAAGCQLVASCDLAIASDTAKFGVNGINIGLFCSTPMVALSRIMPRKKAFELLTTGDFISAPQAAELGLINQAVPATDLETATQAMASKLAAKLGPALQMGKKAFYDQIDLAPAHAYAKASKVMTQNMLREDTAEGIAAFLEKRRPNWSQ